jgi:hypothetical protein
MIIKTFARLTDRKRKFMRRTFRRHIRKRLAPDVPPILQEANFAIDKGEYGRAGELFEKIAETAAARGGPRAPLFYLQAGRARMLAGQIALAMPSLKRGLDLIAQRGAWERFEELGQRAVRELKKHGFMDESQQLIAFLKRNTPREMPGDTVPVHATKRPTLPTHCPSCGAAVRPDEVEWLDEVTAACAYCGSPIR